MEKYKQIVIYTSIFLILILLSIPLHLSSVVLKPSPFGEDVTPPGPAQYDVAPSGDIKSDTINLTGRAEANSKLTVLVNGKEVGETKVSDASRFSITIPLVIGENDISRIVTDQSGNINNTSSSAKVNRVF